MILDSLPDTSKCSFNNPVLNFTLYFWELKDPPAIPISLKALSDTPSLRIFKLAPKEPEPLVEVPTPLCNCKFSIEDAKSGIFTQKVP